MTDAGKAVVDTVSMLSNKEDNLYCGPLCGYVVVSL